MKRLFLLIAVCMIGMVLPQKMLAETVYGSEGDVLYITTSDDGKTVTINSKQAGALWALLEKGEPHVKNPVINAIKTVTGKGSKIVFTGEFCGDDLKKLQKTDGPEAGQYDCCVQETVDMENTTFKKRINLDDAMDAYRIKVKMDDFGHGPDFVFEDVSNERINEVFNSKASTANVNGVHEGDVAVFEKSPQEKVFYQYNNGQWGPTEQPFFASLDRLESCVNNAWEKYAGAMVDGQPTIFQYKTDPTDHQNKWLPLASDHAYEDMTFKYWGSKVKTAITSKNMTADDTFPTNLTENCSALSDLTLSSGSVTTLGGDPPLTTVTIGKDVRSLGGQQLFSRDNIKSHLETIVFKPGGTESLVIGEDCFMGCRNVTSNITIPARTTEIRTQAFKDFGPDPSGDSTDPFVISFEDTETNPSQLSTFVKDAFQNCGITSLVVPSGITEIQGEAFYQCYKLQSITFGETSRVGNDGKQLPLTIREKAFAGGNEGKYKLKDVFVDVNPNTRKLICEYDAFPFVALVGQTDVASEQMATLHFKEDYWDYYAGNWKKGLTFDQSTLDCIKDGCDPSKTGAQMQNMDFKGHTPEELETLINTGYIPGKSPANGWHQFARTNTGIDIIIEKGKDFRTYSTEVALVKPSWMHIYRVTNFDDGFETGKDPSSREDADAATKVATTEEIVVGVEGIANCIPLNTGVIRVDYVANNSIYYIMEWKDLKSAGIEYDDSWEYPYVDDNTKTKVNFMKPTSTPESNPEFTIIGPVEKDERGSITHRVFGLKKVQKDNGITGEFLRAKTNTKMARNRAYLSLPADLFHWIDESTSSTQPATGTIPANNTNNAKISLIIDTDFDLGLNNGIATAIQQVIEKDMYKDDTFYTLQGVKVSKPTTKGVYIHNGKKVLIK